MTNEIISVFAILSVSIVLFITERIRIDIIALMVMVSLTITGLVTPGEALSGFSNPAVVTVWSVLILSGALSRTGIANFIGEKFLYLAGKSKSRLLAVIMLTAGVLSGFMNSIGVTSLLLPAVLDISKKSGYERSKLLIPLSYAALMGGMITLIGTPPNILVSQSLQEAGFEPFKMFDYSPIGLVVMVIGILYFLLFGNKILPSSGISRIITTSANGNTQDLFDLKERMFFVNIGSGSNFIGKTLSDSKIGAALDLLVVAIFRKSETLLSPSPDTIIKDKDRILVEGLSSKVEDIFGRTNIVIESEDFGLEKLISDNIKLSEVEILDGSPFLGKTIRNLDFRQKFEVIVLAIKTEERIHRTGLDNLPLERGNRLLIQGKNHQIRAFLGKDLKLKQNEIREEIYDLEQRLVVVKVPQESALIGKKIIESKLSDSFGLGVLGIVRDNVTQLMPGPEEILMKGDKLLVKGKMEDLSVIDGLKDLEIEDSMPPELGDLQNNSVGLIEVVVSPHSSLVGKNLEEINFRTKYGLNVLAIWREGYSYRSGLKDLPLKYGDALMLYGSRKKAIILSSEPDFLVLTSSALKPSLVKRAPVALSIMIGVIISVILGWMNIAIAVITGVILMVLTGCLTMEEAYRSIQWKAVFLIAGMLPLGIALEKSGAALFLANLVINLIGRYGGLAVLGGLFLLATFASQVMPNPAVVVLLAPIAINTAGEMGISIYPLMMAIAISSSAAFLSPVGHPANVLVMGPGGYKFGDYFRIGLPLTAIIFLLVMLILPLYLPF